MRYSRIGSFMAMSLFFMTFARWNQWYVSSYDDDNVVNQTKNAEILYYMCGITALIGVVLVFIDIKGLMRLIRLIGTNIVVILASVAIILQADAFRDGQTASENSENSYIRERSTGCERLAYSSLVLAIVGFFIMVVEQRGFHLRSLSPPPSDPFCNDPWILRSKATRFSDAFSISSLSMLCASFGYFFYSYDANHNINDDDSPIARPIRILYYLMFLTCALNFLQVLGMLGFEPILTTNNLSRNTKAAYSPQPYRDFIDYVEERDVEEEKHSINHIQGTATIDRNDDGYTNHDHHSYNRVSSLSEPL